jgi:hypothetical protein
LRTRSCRFSAGADLPGVPDYFFLIDMRDLSRRRAKPSFRRCPRPGILHNRSVENPRRPGAGFEEEVVLMRKKREGQRAAAGSNAPQHREQGRALLRADLAWRAGEETVLF